MKQAIQSITRKIHSDAEQHGGERYEQIKTDIDGEINTENASSMEELEKRREALKKNNEFEYMRLIERISGRLNKEVLAYQNELLDEIFISALSKLKKISNDEFINMFKAATKNLSGNFELVPGQFSIDKFDGMVIENAVMDNYRIKIKLSGDTIPNKSGFILRNETVEYNCLFEDLIEEKKAEQAAEIMREVFIS